MPVLLPVERSAGRSAQLWFLLIFALRVGRVGAALLDDSAPNLQQPLLCRSELRLVLLESADLGGERLARIERLERELAAAEKKLHVLRYG